MVLVEISDEQVEVLDKLASDIDHEGDAGAAINDIIEQTKNRRTWIDDVVDFVIQILNDELHITTGKKISQYLRNRMQDLVVTVRME